MKNHFEFAHGQHLDSTPNRLTFHQELQHRYESLQSFDFSTKNLVSYPAVELEGRLDGSLSRNSLSYDMEIKYGKNKAHSKLSAKTSLKHLGDYDIDFYVSFSLTKFSRKGTNSTGSLFIQFCFLHSLLPSIRNYYSRQKEILSIRKTQNSFKNWKSNLERLTICPLMFFTDLEHTR